MTKTEHIAKKVALVNYNFVQVADKNVPTTYSLLTEFPKKIAML